ncbi:hypothetical protein MHY20_11080 [Helcobacillus sp. ACRRO]|uniref:hypothetical protein n=1 Tax=Helcobacillus sp. ACRRO TaxID=2918202 RepID=UPI001EF7169D|nr:hypothetical protein [Helcobacillus sp. ACRRO]MCG7428137.1 hypothetical protein [Helcobacillus sp. ACRRO]
MRARLTNGQGQRPSWWRRTWRRIGDGLDCLDCCVLIPGLLLVGSVGSVVAVLGDGAA